MKGDLRCPICEEGNLNEKIGKNRVDYKGETTELDLHFSVCDSCGSEQANARQVRKNKRYMAAFKKQVDGLLTGSEVRSVREGLGLKQLDAAKIFGGGPVAFSKYEADDVTQSEAMDKLLRVAAKVPEAFDYLVNLAGFHLDVRRIYRTTGRTDYRKLSAVCVAYGGYVGVIHKEYINTSLLMGCLEIEADRTPFEAIESIPFNEVGSSSQYKRLQ